MPPRQLTRAERRSQRTSDLRLMVFVTIAVTTCMFSMLIWMHMTQGVKGQLDRLNGGGDSGLAERKRMLKERVVSTRVESEAAMHEKWEAQRAVDTSSGRTASACEPLVNWAHNVPCKGVGVAIGKGRKAEKEPNVLIVTEHFGPSKSYLFPHYDELGEWQISIQEPSLWNVVVHSDQLQSLYCGKPWLDLTHHFDPYGSASTATLQDIKAAAETINIKHLLKSSDFMKGLIVGVTHNVSALRKGGEQPEERLMDVFGKGMEWVISELLEKPISEWEVSDIEAVHGKACADEPEVDVVGKVRPPTLHVGYGFEIPPPLGFEVGYLMEVYVGWLKMGAANKCIDPVLLSVQAFALLHRMQPFENCNTRVAKLLMNALLMYHDLPPLHMFLHTSKEHLRSLEAAYYSGSPDPLIDFFADNILKSAKLVTSGGIPELATLVRE